jgi:hypothetical protein
MPRAILPIVVLLGITHVSGCGGDDTVNPSNPEAGATAAKDASSGDATDAAKRSEGGSEAGKEAGSDASGGGAEAAPDAPASDRSADAPGD